MNGLIYILFVQNAIKGIRFDEALLRPDNENYTFNKWFWFNPFTGELEVKKENSEYNRAEKTIKLYGLNRKKLTERRLKVNHKKINNSNEASFRFMNK